jgi:hypothetical protein
MIPVHLLGALNRQRAPKGAAGPVTIPPELTGTIPRNVSLTPVGIFLTLVAGAIAAGSIVATVALTVANRRSAEESALRARDAVSAQAEVTAVREVRGDNPREIVSYRFDVDGHPYGGEAVVRLHKGRETAVGARLGIHYMRSDPHTNWIGGAAPPIEPPIFLIPLILLSMLGAASLMAWNIRRQWLLLVDGRPALARVTGTKRIYHEHGHTYRVNYEFQTMSGATVTSRWDSNRRPAAVGSLVPIVYHRETPKWSAVYPLQLVTPQR